MKPAHCPNGCGPLDAPSRRDGILQRFCPACGYYRPLLASEVASMGGRTASDKLTPAERSERARHASRTYRDSMTDEDRERERQRGKDSARKRWGNDPD